MTSHMQSRLRKSGAIAFALALAVLIPTDALAMESTPKQTSARSGYVLPLPPIPYFETMRWMDWQPSAPAFKIDTLLLPDGTRPGVFRLPRDCEPDLARVS